CGDARCDAQPAPCRTGKRFIAGAVVVVAGGAFAGGRAVAGRCRAPVPPECAQPAASPGRRGPDLETAAGKYPQDPGRTPPAHTGYECHPARLPARLCRRQFFLARLQEVVRRIALAIPIAAFRRPGIPVAPPWCRAP